MQSGAGLGASGWRDRARSRWSILNTPVSVLGSGSVAGDDLGCGRSFSFDPAAEAGPGRPYADSGYLRPSWWYQR
jgi:hypothetical protein